MNVHIHPLSLSSLLSFFLITISILTHPSSSAVDSFLYGSCSHLSYNPGTPYEANVKSLLTSLVNSASFANFNNFNSSVPDSSPNDVAYGLFQCRGDLGSSDCRDCVAHAVSQLGTLRVNSVAGALQLEGCFVKYDNMSFLGVDKTVVKKNCGPSMGCNSEALTCRDSLMDSLAAGGQFFRSGGSGNMQGVAQCVQDLSTSECQDCLMEAIGRLKSECGPAAWGDMFLGKCYARYWELGGYIPSYTPCGSNDEDEKTPTIHIVLIAIGLIAGVAMLVVFLFLFRGKNPPVIAIAAIENKKPDIPPPPPTPIVNIQMQQDFRVTEYWSPCW